MTDGWPTSPASKLSHEGCPRSRAFRDLGPFVNRLPQLSNLITSPMEKRRRIHPVIS